MNWKRYTTWAVLILLLSCQPAEDQSTPQSGQKITLEKSVIKDKIMGGWAGQLIGCTYGGPTEFRFNGTMIPEHHYIPWYDGIFTWWYDNAPGLYDDIYMDLTFVEVFEKYGLDVATDSFAHAFAYADYPLWHANQAARYNIRHGIMPPESGHWTKNPHADDIDFQIEADFAGLMAPGMVNSASEICDRVGHIMNYGDGWYGGVYVAAMYALAFVSDDVEYVVKEALRTIPEKSGFYRLISDVIGWYDEYPDDWKQNWFLTQEKWAEEKGCPDGVFSAFNIDAKINAAYIVIGLLYGAGDYGETVRISTLCGQDSDCNPASAGGILGTLLGYNRIPDYWKQGIPEIEDRDFQFTDISLADAYTYSFEHAMEVIEQQGGRMDEETVTLVFQAPQPVALEEGFSGHFPVEYLDHRLHLDPDHTRARFHFHGNGFVLKGGVILESHPEYVAELEVWIDGEKHETAMLPGKWLHRRHELTWAYELETGEHTVELVYLNPAEYAHIEAQRVIAYTNTREQRNRRTIRVE